MRIVPKNSELLNGSAQQDVLGADVKPNLSILLLGVVIGCGSI